MTLVERLVADLRDVLAEEVVGMSVMELSQHSDQSIAETIAHQRAVRRLRALLSELVAEDPLGASGEPGRTTYVDLGQTDQDDSAASGAAWHATYRAGWDAYNLNQGARERRRIDSAVAAGVLTYLKLAPDLERAAQVLAGRGEP